MLAKWSIGQSWLVNEPAGTLAVTSIAPGVQSISTILVATPEYFVGTCLLVAPSHTSRALVALCSRALQVGMISTRSVKPHCCIYLAVIRSHSW